jgi:putative NADH-flavin reductase
MRLTVFGANGKVGRLVVNKLIQKNYQIIAVVNNHSNFIPKNNLITLVNLNNEADLKQSIESSDAVISVVSSWKKNNRYSLSHTMKLLIPILSKNPSKKLISLTGSDARDINDNFNIINFFFHPILNLIAKDVLTDSENHLKILHQTNINWTVLRSPTMKNSSLTKVFYLSIKKRPPIWHRVSRINVATAIIELLDNQEFNQKAPFIF